MARIRYGVAMSLDGYIAGPRGEADWILMDPEIDFAALFAEFDVLLMGRKTYEVAVKRLGMEALGAQRLIVASRAGAADEPGIEWMRTVSRETLEALRQTATKDIWLMGGGQLFRELLGLGEVDGVEVSVVPVLLGGGVPLLPEIAQRTTLRLRGHRVYASGIVTLQYDVVR